MNYECNLIDIYKRECKFNTRDKLLYTRHLKTKKHNYGKDSDPLLPVKDKDEDEDIQE